MAKQPTNRLNVYLIKAEYSKDEDILRDHATLQSWDIKNVGRLYSLGSHRYEPPWIKKFFGTAMPSDHSLFNATSKAVLLVTVQCARNIKRTFAIPFGYGWLFLNHGVWEERFGLKIVLNTVDAGGLKRIDKVNLSSIPKQTVEQMSRDCSAADFGLDIEQDMIQAVQGRSNDPIFGKTITGKDSLSVSASVNILGLADYLKTCFDRYESQAYKTDWGWIDQIAEIKEDKVLKELDDTLTNNVRTGNVTKTWMAVPEIIEWSDVAGFKYGGGKKDALHDDICVADLLTSLSVDRARVSLETFKKNHICCFSSASDAVIHRWSAYHCLYCEINRNAGTSTCLLNNGKWYEVQNDFAQEVNDGFVKLRDRKSSRSLPQYSHKSEGDYNIDVAKRDNTLCCMDAQNISHGGGYSKIEFCDLFTINHEMIHVKRYGGSSVLSHLFSQGVVSGELFLADRDFRAKVNDKLPRTHKLSAPSSKPDASKYRIIFAIISNSTDKLELPFFSKVSLRNAVRRLETYGFSVNLQKISA